ncbi:MAG: lysophospholipid acyltransferase family protein [Candidatus Saccharibacteria bacterium]|nr:lysophospholipid acyltransferase family protein [Candidatus Saccharibacteria bacterium]
MVKRFRRTLAIVGQLIWFPAFWFLAYIICRAKVLNNLNLPSDPKARYIIAANHQSRLDAFIITGILSPRFWIRLLPYRYITANQYLYNPRFTWLLWPLGGFPAFHTKREGSGLEQAQKILISGQTVCIFPEGRRSRPYEEKPKRGVGVLANTPRTYVIPIKLQWRHKPRRVNVSIGKAYKAAGHTPDNILSTIYKLSDV